MILERSTAGARVEHRPHPGGKKGAMMALDEVARRAWAARGKPRVRAWATKQLDACGRPSGRRAQMQCLLDAYRKAVPYVPDPLQVEAMYGPEQTLCLDPDGICVIGGDCDDTAITLAAVFMSVGIPVWIVGASYRDTKTPSHVYIAGEDESGARLRVDGTTDYRVGQAAAFAREWWIDPAQGVTGLEGIPADGEFVGVGAVGRFVAPSSDAERLSLGGRIAQGFGLGLVTPSDVLLYRNMWNDYVLDTVRVARGCSDAYGALAADEQNPQAKQAELELQTSIGKMSDDLLSQWNVFAGKSDDFIVTQGADIVQTLQQTVISAGTVRQTLSQTDKCPMSYVDATGQIVSPVEGPDTSLQVSVISHIEGLGILGAGILQILVGTAEGAVAAAGGVADFVGKQAGAAARILSTPWPWIALLVVVGGGLAVYYVRPRSK